MKDIYIDPVLLTLYLLAMFSVIWYISGCSWSRTFRKFVSKDIDIAFKVTDRESEKAVMEILSYLEKEECKLYMMNNLGKSSRVTYDEVTDIMKRNELGVFRLYSVNKRKLIINVACEHLDFAFKCRCSEKVFNSLINASRKSKKVNS